MVKKDKKHNGVISFWKFMFCMMVVIFHTSSVVETKDPIIMKHGTLACEFFFIVSGYLLAKEASTKPNTKSNNKNLGQETFYVIKKKWLRFLPYVIIGYGLAFIVSILLNSFSLRKTILCIFELTLTTMFGFYNASKKLYHLWYISAMLIAMALLYPQIKKYKKNYFYWIAPLSILFISGFLYQKYHNLTQPTLWIGFTYKGVLRAYFTVCLGTLLYPICEKVKQISFTKLGIFLLTFVEWFGFLITMIVGQFMNKPSAYDFVLVPFIALSVLCAFSEKTLEYKLFCNRFMYYLERLSLPLYVIHVSVRNYLATKNMTYYVFLSQVVFCSIISAMVILYVVEFLQKKHFYWSKIKANFIQ